MLAAGLGAEELSLPLGNLLDRFAALLAAASLSRVMCRGLAFPLQPQAKGFDGSRLQAQGYGRMPVAEAHPAHLKDLFFLVICHVGLLLDAGKPYPWEISTHLK